MRLVNTAGCGLGHHAGMDVAAALAPYPALAPLAPALARVADQLQLVSAAAGTRLFDEAEPCRGFPLLLEGEVRVTHSSGDGRSLELYRVGAGELCLVSSACLFRARPLFARGVAVRDTTLLMVPPPAFRTCLEDADFREWVLGLYAERLADLGALVDAVAFQRLDRRLAAALLGRGPELAVTHQYLADELGTVREMVSRLLHRFEREGWVELGRERIRILDSAALRAQANAA